ncbi:MAG: nitrogen fixation negative regulator NifL [Pseudomonadota bacterium]|nr:nitrogen fixation negative regulator NifL [Pseudomonadota bacterium]
MAESGNQTGLSPQLFYEIVQQSPLAISITDKRARILYVNPAFESLTGFEHKAILGENESVLSHKQTPIEVYRDLWATITGKQSWRGTLVNRRSNGEAYLAELHISPVLDAEGEITNFLGIHRDVTELHALEQQVRHQKTLIESVLDSAPVLVALIDSERQVVLDNQAYKKLFTDLHGVQPAGLFLDALEQDGLDLKAAAADNRGFWNREVRLDLTGQVEPRWFSVSGAWVDEFDSTAGSYFSVPSAGRRCLLVVASEITALKHQMERVKMHHLRASLAEQQRVQGMREALSGAIFQLQTPLNVIQAAASMLERGADPSRTREILGQVLASGHQAMENLRSALPTELQEAETSVNLNALLHDVLTLMTEDFLSQGVTIDWQPQAVLYSINGRPNQLRGMFMRLIENALLALAEAGHDEKEIRIVTSNREDGVEVLIQDNGPGIPEALRLKVFEPFFTAWKQARGRAGMGLPMVQETVNQNGGVVDVNPAFEQGCQIRLRFAVPNRQRALEEGRS